MAHLMYLDSTKSALFDVIFDDDSNPLVRCRERMSRMLVQGFDSSFGTLLRVTTADLHGDVWALGRAMVVDFCCQLRWRFRQFACFPFQWAGFVHPALTLAKQEAFVLWFFSLKPCCRTREFCDKVFDFFWRFSTNHVGLTGMA